MSKFLQKIAKKLIIYYKHTKKPKFKKISEAGSEHPSHEEWAFDLFDQV
jgi:hypothetical protein